MLVDIWLPTNPKRPKAYFGLRLLGAGLDGKCVVFIMGIILPKDEYLSRFDQISSRVVTGHDKEGFHRKTFVMWA